LLRKSRGTTVARRAMIGAIALLVPALAGCEAGQNAPTLEFHPASNGAATVASNISINNVFVLGPVVGSTLPAGSSAGLFLALYNNGAADSLVGASANGAASVKLEKGTVALPTNTSVLLTGPTPELVLTGLTQPLHGGQTISVTLDFSNAGPVTLQVPVEPHSFYYDTYSPAPSPSASASATAKATTKAAKASASASATATTSASPSPSASSTG
jgi:copper(I)-binding protein